MSEDTLKRALTIDTKTLATEINVIDASGKSIAKSVRKLTLDLPPALYKIRYRVGDRVVDDLIELPPGEGEYQVVVPPLPILSAAPLRDSDADAEAASARFSQELIARYSAETKKRASIFVFITAEPESANDPSDLPAKPGSGILDSHFFRREDRRP